jgi:hypothetical protein
MVSVCDVYADLIGVFTDDMDREYVGRLNVSQWSTGMERVLAFRDGGADDRFYDIDFRAMQADPIGEVRGLYEWLGEPVSAAFESGMRRWWEENAEHREPSVKADPETFGLDLDEVRPRFADYVEHVARWTARTSN